MALRFRIGSIPVTIHVFFLLTALLLGSTGGGSAASAVIWVAIVLVSVLAHELGHALAGRLFGLEPMIELHGMGGTTSWRNGEARRTISHPQGLVISAAGPAVGLVLGALVWAYAHYGPTDVHSPAMADFIRSALFVNIGWSLFNLLPILPLDGGQIMARTFGWVLKDRAPKLPHYLSIGLAAALGLYALYIQWLWVVMLAALFAYQNVQALRALRALRDEGPRFDQLAEGERALQRGDGQRAIAVAEELLESSRLLEIRLGAVRLLAHGRLMEGQWGALMDLLGRTRGQLGPVELQRFEQAARELDRPDEAAQIRAWLAELTAPRGATATPFRA